MQERRAGAHHENPGILQPASMGIEQVRRPVQGDGGFAGSRPSLHDDGAVERRADDAVLLRLDGGHNVGHLAGSPRAQGGEQRSFARQRAGGRGLTYLLGMHVEHLVFDARHIAEVEGDVTSHHDVAVGGGGRLVEGSGRLGAPVGEHRFVTAVGHADAADVPVIAQLVVETSEDEPILDRPQLREPVFIHGGERIAFGALGGGAVGSGRAHRVQPAFRFVSQVVQPRIGAVDRLLFLMKLGRVTRHAVVVPS